MDSVSEFSADVLHRRIELFVCLAYSPGTWDVVVFAQLPSLRSMMVPFGGRRSAALRLQMALALTCWGLSSAGGDVTAPKRMTWATPQPGGPKFRKDLMEGAAGVIEGWADLEQGQVLFKVAINLQSGPKQTAVQEAFPRNLNPTSEYNEVVRVRWRGVHLRVPAQAAIESKVELVVGEAHALAAPRVPERRRASVPVR